MKVAFDIQKDADALLHHFEIRMQCVIDLQIMGNAARSGTCWKSSIVGHKTNISSSSGIPTSGILHSYE